MIIPLLANLVLWWGIIAGVQRLLDDSPDAEQTATNGSFIPAEREGR